MMIMKVFSYKIVLILKFMEDLWKSVFNQAVLLNEALVTKLYLSQPT